MDSGIVKKAGYTGPNILWPSSQLPFAGCHTRHKSSEASGSVGEAVAYKWAASDPITKMRCSLSIQYILIVLCSHYLLIMGSF